MRWSSLARLALALPPSLAGLLFAPPSLAEPAEGGPYVVEPRRVALPLEEAAPARKPRPARLVMGLKFGGGGTLWDQPDDTVLSTYTQNGAPQSFTLPIFDETRGGYTLSTGFFVEGIFFEHLGLEIGMQFVQHNLLETIEWTYTETTISGGQTSVVAFQADSEQTLKWTAVHIPILLKAVIPTESTRVSLGVGPEFALSSWGRSSFRITDGGVDDGSGNMLLPGSRSALRSVDHRLRDSVYLAVAFGLEITAGDFVVPIDIHWGYNLSQPRAYRERVAIAEDTLPSDANPDVHPSAVELQTRDTMYGGLRVGLAYQF
jgi:hypothetical protein